MKGSRRKNVSTGQNKGLRAVIYCIAALLFVVSVVYSVFSGGEIVAANQNSDVVKGMMRLNNTSYNTSYLAGDKFVFDKENADILLIAKDPLIKDMVKVENLPATEYGFQINGEGEIYEEPSDITLTADVKSISVVSVVYPDIKVSIPVSVLGNVDTSKLTNEVLLEAEDMDLYDTASNLLSYEDKCTLPTAEKPYISSEGEAPSGLDCSGGACLRNFSVGMKLVVTVVCSEATEADLTVLCCMRPAAGTFASFFDATFNGEHIAALDNQNIPGAGSGYYTMHTMNTVKVQLSRGINTFVIKAKGATVNLDAFRFTAANAVLGDMSVVTE